MISSVQAFIASGLKEKIEERIGSRVEIEKVNLGFLNRIIVDGFEVYDQNKERFLKSSRVSVKIDLIDLMSGKINLTSAQIFGLDANIYKNSPNGKLNFQFIVDSLASKDTTSNTPLNLQISSLVIRNGAVKYNLRYLPQKNEKFERLTFCPSPSPLYIFFAMNKGKFILSAKIIINNDLMNN